LLRKMAIQELRVAILLKSRILWPFIGWILFLAPMLLVLAGYFIPNMLRGLVLLRTENAALEYSWDCACLTAMGMFVSALGAAIVRMFDLYAMLQFGYRSEADSVHSPLERRTMDQWWWSHQSTAWPIAIIILWGIVSIGYPVYCCWETLSDIDSILKVDPQHKVPRVQWGGAVLGIVGGASVASSFLLMVSIAHLLSTRKSRSACGLLPFEDVAARVLDRWIGPVTNERAQAGFVVPSSWGGMLRRFLGPGFFSPATARLLPGHLQLVFFMGFAFFGYYLLFDSAYGKKGWSSAWFPVGVYAMLLLFLMGGVAALLSFILGRLRFHLASVSLMLCGGVLLLLLFVRYGGFIGWDMNRYVAIVEPKGKGSVDVKRTQFSNITDEDGSFVRIAKSKFELVGNDPSSKADSGRKTLKDIYGTDKEDKWHIPRGPDGKRTMIVVTASGGGIQAATWTAKVLANMDAECSAFSESIGLVSGVSGGSVGAMYYLGKRGFRKNSKSEELKPPVCMSIAPNTREAIQKAASDSSLEAIGWGLAFPDLARMVPGLNLKVSKEDDRGLALESQWWTRMGREWPIKRSGGADAERAQDETSMMRELRMRDLLPATNQGLIPPVIFNATTVETGQRTMIATFATNPEATSSKASANTIEYERISKPIDFFGFYEPLFLNPLHVNPRVSAAVRLSSSFAYVTPVARPTLPTDLLKPNLTDFMKLRKNYHLCDGGYSENTGLVAALRVITELINQHIEEKSAPPFDRILFLSIESFPDNLVETDNDVTGISSGIIGPLSAIFASRVASQAERAELELELLIRSDDQAASFPFKLSIACIQFRFDPRTRAEPQILGEKTKVTSKDSKVPDPPLSWMLSPYDKYRIDLAWENQLQRLKGTVRATAPGKNETDDRLMSPDGLRKILRFDKKASQP
jgi:Patatin-like phospholipase